MSGVREVDSHPRLSDPISSGGAHKTPPPPKSPNRIDTLSNAENASSEAGMFSSISSTVSFLFSFVMSGFSFVLSIACWPLEAIGLLSEVEEAKEEEPTVNLEKQKEEMTSTFSSSSHAERLKLLIFQLAVWEVDSAEKFFIELFNKQDGIILVALANRLMPGLKGELEAIKAQMPKLLFGVFRKKQEDRNFHETKLVETVDGFLLEFPDYLLTHVAAIFESEAPSWSKFQVLGRLAKYLDGCVQDFHVKTIGEKSTEEAINEAFCTYYGKLSQEEKEKLLGLVRTEVFEDAEKELVAQIIDKCLEPGMDEIFSSVPGYPTSGEKFQENFGAFLRFIIANNPQEWLFYKGQILEEFDSIRFPYLQELDETFVACARANRVDVCRWAYESEPAIYKMRLEVLAESECEAAIQDANSQLLRDNYDGALGLFHAYRDVEVNTNRKREDQFFRECQFFREWQSLYNFVTGEPIDHAAFIEKMESLQQTPSHKAAAQKILLQLFPEEKD